MSGVFVVYFVLYGYNGEISLQMKEDNADNITRSEVLCQRFTRYVTQSALPE